MINSGCLQPPLGGASEFAVYFIIIEFNKAKSTLLPFLFSVLGTDPFTHGA